MRFVTDLSKGILGKPDSFYLWDEVTSNIPDKVLLKKDLKILNVACGHGTEADVLVKRMKLLGRSTSDIKDSLYLLDKYSVFTKDAKRKGYTNVIQADFVNWGTDMKFDVIIGNPPYQDGDNPSAKLWNRFVQTSFNHLKDDGYIAMIHPLVWMRRPNGQASDKLVKDILSKNQLIYVDATATKHFNVGEEVSAYILQKTPRYTNTEFKFLDRQEVIEYTGQKLPLTLDEGIALKIFDKVMAQTGDRIGNHVWCDYGGDATIDQRIERNQFTIGANNTNTQPVYWTAANNNYYFADPSKSKKGIKIIINRSGYYYVKDNVDKYIKLDLNDQFAVGVAGYALSFQSEDLARNCLSYLTSKLYAWFVEYEKSGGYNTGVPKLGYLDINKTWTDSDVYDFYGLTKEERDYIDASVK